MLPPLRRPLFLGLICWSPYAVDRAGCRAPLKQHTLIVKVAPQDAAADAQTCQLRQQDVPPNRVVLPCGGPLSLNGCAAEGFGAALVQEPLYEVGIKHGPAHRL